MGGRGGGQQFRGESAAVAARARSGSADTLQGRLQQRQWRRTLPRASKAPSKSMTTPRNCDERATGTAEGQRLHLAGSRLQDVKFRRLADRTWKRPPKTVQPTPIYQERERRQSARARHEERMEGQAPSERPSARPSHAGSSEPRRATRETGAGEAVAGETGRRSDR
jgi:hypothetical protein